MVTMASGGNLRAGALRFADGLPAALGFVQDFGGEDVGKMMLADDDFGVDAKLAGAARISMTRPVGDAPPCG